MPEDNNFWDNFLMLLTIMDYIFAPVTNADKADYVAMLVEDFLTDFKDLYPERPLTPKMHYMIHLPSWMKWYVCISATYFTYTCNTSAIDAQTFFVDPQSTTCMMNDTSLIYT